MKSITVFTPTYNRAYCLNQLYESLLRQTSKDFLWLIIDDGSSDSTQEVVSLWIKDNKIAIQYHYQENKGTVYAHNTAHYLMDTELCVCIDSDDYMPDGLSMNLFNKYKQNPKSFAFYRIAKMRFALNYKERFQNAIHYCSSSIMAKNMLFLKESPCKITTLLAIPFGIMLYFYLTNTKSKTTLKIKK